jgi:hypothetical protein
MKTINKRAHAVFAVLVAPALGMGSEPRDKSTKTDTGGTTAKIQRNYATVNGLNMYYEIHGTGRPLVLLHGGLTTIDSSFEKVLPPLAKTRQVIAIEQQGHRSA